MLESMPEGKGGVTPLLAPGPRQCPPVGRVRSRTDRPRSAGLLAPPRAPGEGLPGSGAGSRRLPLGRPISHFLAIPPHFIGYIGYIFTGQRVGPARIGYVIGYVIGYIIGYCPARIGYRQVAAPCWGEVCLHVALEHLGAVAVCARPNPEWLEELGQPPGGEGLTPRPFDPGALLSSRESVEELTGRQRIPSRVVEGFPHVEEELDLDEPSSSLVGRSRVAPPVAPPLPCPIPAPRGPRLRTVAPNCPPPGHRAPRG